MREETGIAALQWQMAEKGHWREGSWRPVKSECYEDERREDSEEMRSNRRGREEEDEKEKQRKREGEGELEGVQRTVSMCLFQWERWTKL